MLHRLSLLGIAVALCAPAPAQSVTLLSNLDTRSQYAGCWGYAAPDGREFALVGERTGLWIVETTNPSSPVEVGHFSAPSSTWREVTSYGPHVYSVSEHHSGIRVIDMSNPGSPNDLGYIATGDFSSAHSISIDPGAGHLYVNGARSGSGMWIYDVGTNPTNPPQIGRYREHYVHDSYIRRGRAYLSEIYSGQCRILDVTDMTKVSSSSTSTINSITHAAITTPGQFTHNSWTTDDDLLLATTDENNSGRTTFYDISNVGSPIQRGIYGSGAEITHNVFLLGRMAYIAHYSAGLHVVDASDPQNPRHVGDYDTSSRTSGFNGMWGAYPFQPSGVVYGSDISNGLFVFRIECGHINRFGKGTAGTGGAVPWAQADGAPPSVGAQAFRMEVSELVPNADFALVIGPNQTQQTLAGVDLHVDLNGAIVFYGQADGNGYAEVSVPIPGNNALANQKFYAQVLALDAQGPLGVTASRGMWFGICP